MERSTLGLPFPVYQPLSRRRRRGSAGGRGLCPRVALASVVRDAKVLAGSVNRLEVQRVPQQSQSGRFRSAPGPTEAQRVTEPILPGVRVHLDRALGEVEPVGKAAGLRPLTGGSADEKHAVDDGALPRHAEDRDRSLDEIALAVEADISEKAVLDPCLEELSRHRGTRPVGAGDRVEEDLGGLRPVDGRARSVRAPERRRAVPRESAGVDQPLEATTRGASPGQGRRTLATSVPGRDPEPVSRVHG